MGEREREREREREELDIKQEGLYPDTYSCCSACVRWLRPCE